MSVYVNKKKFAERPQPACDAPEKEKKINLKIEKDDLRIIDAVCEEYDISRTALMNELLEMAFLSQIRMIGDVRLETMLLHRADSKARWQRSETPWTHVYLADQIDRLVGNLIETGSEDGDFYALEALPQEALDRFDSISKFLENIDKAKKNEQ